MKFTKFHNVWRKILDFLLGSKFEPCPTLLYFHLIPYWPTVYVKIGSWKIREYVQFLYFLTRSKNKYPREKSLQIKIRKLQSLVCRIWGPLKSGMCDVLSAKWKWSNLTNFLANIYCFFHPIETHHCIAIIQLYSL